MIPFALRKSINPVTLCEGVYISLRDSPHEEAGTHRKCGVG